MDRKQGDKIIKHRNQKSSNIPFDWSTKNNEQSNPNGEQTKWKSY